MNDHLDNAFSFSNRHLDLMARDAEYVFGWRYEPRIIFERGEGVKLFDVDGNEYYDLRISFRPAKILAGGLPGGAVAGRKDILDLLDIKASRNLLTAGCLPGNHRQGRGLHNRHCAGPASPIHAQPSVRRRKCTLGFIR